MWCSSTVKRVVRSTLSAEAYAVSETVETSEWIRQVLEEIWCASDEAPQLKDVESRSQRRRITVRTDSDNLVSSVSKDAGVVQDKRLRIVVAMLRQVFQAPEGNVFLVWITTLMMLADGLTKILDLPYLRSWLRAERVQYSRQAHAAGSTRTSKTVAAMVALSQVGLSKGHQTDMASASVSDALGVAASSSGVELHVSGLSDWQFAFTVVALVAVSMIAGSWMTILLVYGCGGEIRRRDRLARRTVPSTTSGDAAGPADQRLQPERRLQEEQSHTEVPAAGDDDAEDESASIHLGASTDDRRPERPVSRSRIQSAGEMASATSGSPRTAPPARTAPQTAMPSVLSDSSAARSNELGARERVRAGCPQCGARMELRAAHHGGYFYGCESFPLCRGTRRPRHLAGGEVVPGRA